MVSHLQPSQATESLSVKSGFALVAFLGLLMPGSLCVLLYSVCRRTLLDPQSLFPCFEDLYWPRTCTLPQSWSLPPRKTGRKKGTTETNVTCIWLVSLKDRKNSWESLFRNKIYSSSCHPILFSVSRWHVFLVAHKTNGTTITGHTISIKSRKLADDTME
jgi:hypothetical protein